MEPAGRKSTPGPSTPYVMTGRDTIKVGDHEYRIKQITVGGKPINFEDLRHSEQAFKQEIMGRAEKSLHHFEEAILDQQKGTYTLSLSKEKTTLTMKEDAGFIHEHNTKNVGKREERLNDIQTKANEILVKRDEWNNNIQKHSFKKEIPHALTEAVIKVGVVVGAILFSPVFLVIGGLIHVGLALSNLKAKVIDGQTLKKEGDKMKAAEEKAKLEGMQGVARAFSFQKVRLAVDSGNLYNENVMQNKVTRYVERALKREGAKLNQTQMDQLKLLKNEDFKDVNALKLRLITLIPELDEILTNSDFKTLINESAAIHQDSKPEDLAKLRKLWFSLEPDLTKNQDPAITNQLITANLREVINSPMYQALKEDPNNEYVLFVHSIACSIWNSNTTTMHAYQEFGKAILKDQNIPSKEGAKVDGPTMRKVLEDSHIKTSQELLTDHGIPQKILYAFTHPRQALGSMASEGGNLRLVAEAFGYGIYDSHGDLRNNPSLQGTTKATIQTDKGLVEASINNCYGGSPTVGDQISPEFLAVCQAAENNRFATVKDPKIPSVVYYTNFQDIENKHGEGERSFAIMELNRRFPLSFMGMTLSKDSDFYKMKGVYENAGWSSANEFGQEFLKVLQNDKCYQYGNRAGDSQGSGIYLPGGEKAWKDILPKMIDRADKHFEKIEANYPKPISPENAAKLRGAYQEYIYSMIQAHTEMELAKEAGATDSPVLIMAIRVCKENVDRGSAENAKYLHTRLGSDVSFEEHTSLVTGCLESRAVSSRDRVILDHRLPQVMAFIELVDREEFNKDMIQVHNELGLKFEKSPHFNPANTAPASFVPDEVNFSDEE